MTTATKIPPKRVIRFGKHEGQLLTRLPVDYLQWLAAQSPAIVRDGDNWSELAAQELERRGTSYGGIMPSHHAIDRFSIRHLGRWDQSRGIASYLSDLAAEAWQEGEQESVQCDGTQTVVKKRHEGIGFVFVVGVDGNPHSLKTVL